MLILVDRMLWDSQLHLMVEAETLATALQPPDGAVIHIIEVAVCQSYSYNHFRQRSYNNALY